MQEQSELEKKLRPVSGKVIVRMDKIDPLRQSGLIWMVDTSAAKDKVRVGTVVAVTRVGRLLLGWKTAPHEVAPGDRVVIERTAAKLLPGKTMGSGELIAIWELYIAAILEDERHCVDCGADLPETVAGMGLFTRCRPCRGKQPRLERLTGKS